MRGAVSICSMGSNGWREQHRKGIEVGMSGVQVRGKKRYGVGPLQQGLPGRRGWYGPTCQKKRKGKGRRDPQRREVPARGEGDAAERVR